jgi:GNAT superfamily N-acetyltransferase
MTATTPRPARPLSTARPSPQPGAITASPADTDALSHLIADAFFGLPPSRWLIADPATRRAIFPAYFRIYVEHTIATGIVHTTPDRTAAALWLPTGTGLPGPPPGYGQRLAAVTGPHYARFACFDATLQCHHPAGTAHHHLALMAVAPGHQGHGTGSMLLRAHHATLDDGGIPAYLEAATGRTRHLYHRHGYTLRPDAPIRLPDSGTLLWPMWREPRTTS